MICPNCRAHNRPERRFCTSCGTALAMACPACGAPREEGDAFCGQCGASLTADPAVGARTALPPPAPVSEMRHVSVLFCDLVGFTTLSEHRDPEDVRELLSRYFETARSIVERYGGTVEKFIGDAVMAVWGFPTANEDDGERAVRAALDLVAAVDALGTGSALPGLAARAGVLTGDAAVTLGASGQGMVAGDLVNAASRLQAAADPGTVLVGEATFLAARDAVAFEGPKALTVKGRDEPISAWRATRVVAQRRGAGRSTQLEPPFVGREEQLRLLVDLLHSTGREGKARFVSVTGIAGIGKSRLAAELLRYVDGLAETVFWHHGRSPSYGEGITFWALAEMVRMRARISELDDETTARRKLVDAVAEHVELPDERRWVERSLAHLLGVSEPTSADRQELFSAWRTFFERIAAQGTVVMVFEDLQWADAGLLDFVESIAEWSRAYPILVLALARPELADRRRGFGSTSRDYTSLHLDPLPAGAMRQLLHGLVRGLPDDVAEQLVRRADGVPLHAVEMVRSLCDQGAVVQLDDGYELLGEVRDLELPDSLQSLIAARLDTLPASERALLQDAAVLGTTFAPAALAAVSGTDEASATDQLRDLVRREFLTVDVDPRSPERGQYGFVQGVVREVAYGTLSKRDRRAKHLASAAYFQTLGDDELAGLVAAHYLDAYRATAPGPERDEVAELARAWLERAVQRALSLGSPEQALAYAEEGLEVTAADSGRAAMLCLASRAAQRANASAKAKAYAAEAMAIYEGRGEVVAAGQAAVELLIATTASDGDVAASIGQGQRALSLLPERGAEEVRAALSMWIGELYLRIGEYVQGLELADQAVGISERLDDALVFARAIGARATALYCLGRHREAALLQRGVTGIFDSAEAVSDQAVSRMRECAFSLDDDPRRSMRIADEAAELARRAGDRRLEVINVLNAAETALLIGDWGSLRERLSRVDTLARTHRLHENDAAWKDILEATLAGLTVDDPSGADSLARLRPLFEEAEHVQLRTTYLRALGYVHLAHGAFDDVVAAVRPIVAADPDGINTLAALGLLGHAALWRRDAALAHEARALMASFHGRWALAARATIDAGVRALEAAETGPAGDAAFGTAERFRAAAEAWRGIDAPLDLALCGLDAAILLAPEDQPAELVEEARRILDDIGAAPLLSVLAERTAGLATSP